MALVLCDGEAASLKTLEVSSVPGLLLKKHDNRQLVVLSAWRDTRPINPTTAGVDESAAGPNQAQIQFMQTQLAPVTNALTTINGSRYTQNTLNYAIETHRVLMPKRVEAADAANLPKQPQQQPSKPPAPGTTIKQPTPPPMLGHPSDNIVGADAANSGVNAAEAADAFGQHVVDHALTRAKAHGIRTIAFGVGNAANEKKQIIVGSVGKALLRSLVYNPSVSTSSRFRSVLKTHREVEVAGLGLTRDLLDQVKQHHHHSSTSLFAIKSTGAAVRPTTGSRILVLMFPEYYASKAEVAALGPNDALPATNIALNAAIALARSGQDRVGILVVTNNAQAKSTEEQEDTAPPSYSAMVDEVFDILIDAGLTGNNDEEEDDNNSPSGDEVAPPPPPTQQRPADDAMSMYGATAANQNVNANAQMLAAFPLVSYMTFEPTRDFPQAPTIDQVPQQLVRQLNAIKADVLVIPPPMSMLVADTTTTTPSSLKPPASADITGVESPSSSVIPMSVVEVLLGMPKPHVLISGTQ